MNPPLQSASGVRILLILASLVIIIAGLKAASAIVVPLLVAMFLAMLATPPMLWLRDRHLPTGVALSLIVALLIGIVAILGSLIGSSINELSGALPVYEQKLRLSLELTVAYLREQGIDLPTAGVAEWIDPQAAARFFGRLLSGFGGILSDSLLIIFMVFFLLLEATAIPAKLRSILPDPERTLMNFSAKISVFGGRKVGEELYAETVEIGRMMAKENWLVFCGGGPGVMEAISRGVKEGGGTCIGILSQV